jgi:ribosomal-protein-alanine N-acetyltransferase
MSKISIRYQQLKDAKRFFEIVTNPRFIYFSVNIKSIADEIKWLKAVVEKRRKNIEWDYTILYRGQVVGGISLKINHFRPYIGEIGYFIDEKYWGRGLATQAVKLVEREGFKKIGLSRIEILMRPKNKASEKVAKKNNYLREGRLKKFVKDKRGQMQDVWLYAKVL